MIIAEILNKVPDYKVLKDTDEIFKVESTINDRKIYVAVERTDDENDLWEVVFYEQNAGGSEWNLTKNGGEFQVFALAKDVIMQVIKKRDPAEIGFSADKAEGREKLYQKLVDKFIIPGYEVSKLNPEKSHSIFFSLTKKK